VGKGHSHHPLRCRHQTARTTPRAWLRLLDVDQISEIIRCRQRRTFKRPIYAGTRLLTVASSASVQGHHRYVLLALTIRLVTANRPSIRQIVEAFPSVQDAADLYRALSAKAGQVRPSRTGQVLRFRRFRRPRGMQKTVTTSSTVSLADKLSALLYVLSRAVETQAFVPNDMQVGQTGKIVAGPGKKKKKKKTPFFFCISRVGYLRCRFSTWRV